MPFENLFAINRQWLYGPDGYAEEPVPVVGYNLAGEPVRQGYPALTFTWSFLRQEQMTALWNAYDPAFPRCEVTYVDKATGLPTTKQGMMHEPIVGARQVVSYANVADRRVPMEPPRSGSGSSMTPVAPAGSPRRRPSGGSTRSAAAGSCSPTARRPIGGSGTGTRTRGGP